MSDHTTLPRPSLSFRKTRVTDTVFTAASDLESGYFYRWRVRAWFGDRAGAWTDASFSIDGPPAKRRGLLHAVGRR